MYSHIFVGSNDLDRSKAFYDALFAVLDAASGKLDAKGRLVYARDGAVFMVTRPIDGAAATPANGGTIGFRMTRAQADAWHAAGISHGGTTCEDPPGLRYRADGSALYLAYLRDPDGNKLCALHAVPAEG